MKNARLTNEGVYVELTRGYETLIDLADLELVQQFNWYCESKHRTHYAHRIDYSGEKPKSCYLHRLLLNPEENIEVDHINGNGLDNRRCNLRLASNSQNKQNSRKRANNSSGYKGVSWHKHRNKWQAAIKFNGKTKYLGLFATPELAHNAYKEASEKFHKEFSNDGTCA